jgi:predicted lipoprotein with Yx(FWY)xxD motif
MRDMLDDVATDDWPAFTSAGTPVAGEGVNAALLGTVRRRGVGSQVTYAGHPLYLFDPSSGPFVPQGEGYVETVAPLAPWHGYWWLVSSVNGAPAPGVVTLETETLPNGRTALAVEEDENVYPFAISVYSLERGQKNPSPCTFNCPNAWPPLLSLGTPHLGHGVAASDVGVIHEVDGVGQVTYQGKPLYLYAKEKVFLTSAGVLKTSGSDGNGQLVEGPSDGFSLVYLNS